MDNIDCHPLLIFQENDNDGQASIPLYSEFLNDNLFENIFFNDDNLIDMTSYQASFPSYSELPNDNLFENISFNNNLIDMTSSRIPSINDIDDFVNISIPTSDPVNDNISPNSESPGISVDPVSSTTSNKYQYNLEVGDCFDDWSSVDTFIHQYCFERGFGYQVFRNDKDPIDSTIIRRKSFRCSSSNTYKARKDIDQTSHRLRGTMKTSCEWYCNFTFPKSAYQVKCTTLKGVHNHEISSSQVHHFIARYRRLSDEMIQDLKFFMDCKVAPITQLEILKKKYPGHVFHKQDIYNAIYKLRQNNDDNLDSTLLLDVLFEKISFDLRWKVFIRHAGNERRLSGIFWMSPTQQELYQRFSDVVLNDNTCKTNKYNMYLSVFMIKDNYGKFRNVANALVEDELASTYVWILQCLTKATNTIPKSFWTDSEPGLINAVSQVFPDTPHFYCLFHIWQNIIKHLKSKVSDFGKFSKAFFSCRNALSILIFEQR